MKVVLQRVKEAQVSVKEDIVGKINKGLLVLVGFTQGDTEDDIKWIVNKMINLRIFDDLNGNMNLSIKDVKGQILSVSQFTLYASIKKGNRPSYLEALNPKEASVLYDKFNEEIKKNNITLQKGIFGEDMNVSLTNDGPVTIIIEK